MKTLALVAATAVFLTGCQNESIPSSIPSTETLTETSTSVEVTPTAFNVGGAPTVELSVPNMYCEYSCVAKVKEILSEQAGVREVKVDFETKRATLAVDQSTFDGQGTVAALIDYQFTDSKLIAPEGVASIEQ